MEKTDFEELNNTAEALKLLIDMLVSKKMSLYSVWQITEMYNNCYHKHLPFTVQKIVKAVIENSQERESLKSSEQKCKCLEVLLNYAELEYDLKKEEVHQILQLFEENEHALTSVWKVVKAYQKEYKQSLSFSMQKALKCFFDREHPVFPEADSEATDCLKMILEEFIEKKNINFSGYDPVHIAQKIIKKRVHNE